MTRPLRVEYEGAIYHVTNRGNARADIFLDDIDRQRFLDVLARITERMGWVCHGYCLMGNHYHLMIETPVANLSRGMRQLNGVYTQDFNRAHGRVGHVFQGRYKAIIVERESYLLALCRYVVLNPVRAGLVRAPKDWRWSSYRATAGLIPPPAFLTTEWVLSQFGEAHAQHQAYRTFTAKGRGVTPWDDLKGQVCLGGKRFAEELSDRIKRVPLDEVARTQRHPDAPSLSDVEANAPTRDDAIVAAWQSGAHTQSDIGRHFGLHYSRVSRIIKAKSKT